MSSCALGQGHVTMIDCMPCYYRTVIDKLYTTFDIHHVFITTGACSMSVSFRCNCSTSPFKITLRTRSKASNAHVSPHVLAQWFEAKIACSHVECCIMHHMQALELNDMQAFEVNDMQDS